MSLTSIISHYRGDYEKRYKGTISAAQNHALNAILKCRSGRYGKMYLDCYQCDVHDELNHSCGHRFCHRCQHHDTKCWVERQQRKLLPVDYFLVTFTLPRQLRSLAFKHQKTLYALLFDCAVSTLKTFMANDTALQAQAGMTAVLHTHSRRLDFHPHIHVVIPSGGINRQQKCWVQKNQDYLFRQQNLATVFRARMLDGISEAGISLPSDLPRKWIVDCRHTGRGLSAIKYLSRYLYRGVISEEQIVGDDGKYVTFKYVCSDTGKRKIRRLEGHAFLRLLFRHVLPKGFRRARDYGFLHGNARVTLQLIQLILRVACKPVVDVKRADFLCRHCKQPMRITAFVKDIGEYG